MKYSGFEGLLGVARPFLLTGHWDYLASTSSSASILIAYSYFDITDRGRQTVSRFLQAMIGQVCNKFLLRQVRVRKCIIRTNLAAHHEKR